MTKIFLVDDDVFFGEMLKYHLQLNPDYEVYVQTSAKECLAQLYKNPDIICIDFGLPDIQGDELFTQIKNTYPELPIIVISGQENISVAINFLKQGAKDYIVKNEHTKELLWNSIIRINENITLKQEVEGLKDELEKKYSFEKTIIGQSESIKNIFPKINKALKSNINISITGETGTGKEVIAKAIHYNSIRKNKPFIAVNMAAIPKELVESEFFGHEKGAFTGANERASGKFEQANGGTIFLDEIAELDLNLQSKLLRALQEREITRVGGNQKIQLDVRVITATHKNLAQEVKKGNFREDLYYRIFGLPIELPPLRDRDQDILILARYFIEIFSKDNKIKPLALSADAKKKLLAYNFPGNVRELKSVIDLACVMSDNNEITAEDINFYTIEKDSESFICEQKTLKQHTVDIILHFLKKNNNDVIKTAKALDIGKSTIYNLLNNVDIKK
ncbi:sigma-54 dependent transcriptional regulator [Elizabethkingia meningoseptica]|uniref:sigma-54-dependent transcriptional regulator n=1 Tax=Elizabethkingia meningoseptica TaxID=238 RepID=UPI0022F153F2|nr:sigma-54 dependent transcriptional regulator [Elizabethkingia meningoseptica]EJK5329670.1 sigma-54-dependent Fis family transcriptional regulator [Elizabethkingia meningoseptica]MDE5430897.1 sigma-54 dependent transcriptional regulator [Elizabethkingia meningoseptica]MDE5467959.1 sigma-54 dependent transcriptional regulator [Elizabethkingia meningoseptica]MDE5474878.1 sigma-54 dependent transcriptional regulator [Elizabethkingia meningoseptica]MDE5478311.1 sigma-54 dependent transcriptional